MADTLSPRALARRNDRLRVLLLLALLVLVGTAAALVVYLRPHSTGERIELGELLTLTKDRRVVTATIRDEDALLVGEAKPGRTVLPKGGRFNAELPKEGILTAQVTSLLAATSAHVEVDHQSGKDTARVLLTSLLPVLVLTDLIALVLLTSPYGDRLATAQRRRARHELPTDLGSAVAVLDPPSEAGPDEVAAPPVPVKRAAAPRKRAPAKAVAELAEPVPVTRARKAPATKVPAKAPGKRTAAKAAEKAAAKATGKATRKAPSKAAPAKARPAEDVLPPARPTRRRSSS